MKRRFDWNFFILWLGVAVALFFITPAIPDEVAPLAVDAIYLLTFLILTFLK